MRQPLLLAAVDGDPTSLVAKTGACAYLPVTGPSLGGASKSDGIHQTPTGNDYIATQLAKQEPALVAVWQNAA